MHRLLDRAAQLTHLRRETASRAVGVRDRIEETAPAATRLFAHRQTTERTVTAANSRRQAAGPRKLEFTVNRPAWTRTSNGRCIRPGRTNR
jgi:hypothetical protein